MTALIIVSLVAGVATVGVVLLSRQLPALVAKLRANDEQHVIDRDALRAATLRANEQEALHTYERARADDATEQLGKTQIALEAAKALVARERVKRIEGMSVDELLVGVNAEIAALSEQPGTALEKPE
jgi:hypothetical protein